MGLNVYLSSPYMEFKDIRDEFLHEIKSRSHLYDVNAMEKYLAKDDNVLLTCISDVEKCDIYVLILGDKYGSIANKDGKSSGKSFTYWEYETANKKKAGGGDVERLILLKEGDSLPDEDPLLTNWKKEIGASQIQTKYYSTQEEIPKKIIASLDGYSAQRIDSIKKTDFVMDKKVYLCNRQEINQQFLGGLDDDPMQFFILSGHENDRPAYFVNRKEFEFESMSVKWKPITILPVFPPSVTRFEQAEAIIKTLIWGALKWKNFRLPKDVTPAGIIQYMIEADIDYLSITWEIKSELWKNEDFKRFIVAFYQEYNMLNAELKTEKRILFFGILKYVPNETVSEQQFNEMVSNIQWEINMGMFNKKINKDDVKSWLNENVTDGFEARNEDLIARYLSEINLHDMYYKDIERGLLNILTATVKK